MQINMLNKLSLVNAKYILIVSIVPNIWLAVNVAIFRHLFLDLTKCNKISSELVISNLRVKSSDSSNRRRFNGQWDCISNTNLTAYAIRNSVPKEETLYNFYLKNIALKKLPTIEGRVRAQLQKLQHRGI